MFLHCPRRGNKSELKAAKAHWKLAGSSWALCVIATGLPSQAALLCVVAWRPTPFQIKMTSTSALNNLAPIFPPSLSLSVFIHSQAGNHTWSASPFRSSAHMPPSLSFCCCLSAPCRQSCFVLTERRLIDCVNCCHCISSQIPIDHNLPLTAFN